MATISFVIANNVNTTLATALASGATTMTLASSANLPTLSAGQVMPLTLNDAATGQIYEVVYVTAISGVTLTVQRAQEGTGAQNWNIGDFVYCAPTEGSVAVKNGDPAQQFMVATATASNQAVNLGQANTAYAALHGSASNTFAVANATASNQAVSLGQANAAYAPIAGNASQTFAVGAATAANQAVQLAQVQDGQSGLSGVITPANGATLDVTMLGELIQVGGGNTYTLAALSTFASANGLVCINSSSAQVATINVTGSDEFNLGSATNVTTFLVQPGQLVQFIKASGGAWRPVGVSVNAVLPLVIAAATAGTHAVQLQQVQAMSRGFQASSTQNTTTATLTNAISGAILRYTASANGSATLPAVSAMPSGFNETLFVNTTSFNWVLTTNSGDSIIYAPGNTAFTSITLHPGDELSLVPVSTSIWLAIGGSALYQLNPLNVAAATAATHAVQLTQMTAAIAAAVAGYLPLSGGALTGPVSVPNNTGFQAKTTGGVATTLAFIDTSNNINLGNNAAPTIIGGSSIQAAQPVTVPAATASGHAMNASQAFGSPLQTYSALTGSRAIGTTFTNSTGRPIWIGVAASAGASGSSIGLAISGLGTIDVSTATVAAQAIAINGIIPPGATYVVTSSGTASTLVNWNEYR